MIYENYYGSIVFVTYDENKIPKYAQIKILNEQILEDKRRNSIVVEGSDYKESWRENSYISLLGVNPNMLLGLLERRKYSKIYMCLDNDKAGIEVSYKN